MMIASIWSLTRFLYFFKRIAAGFGHEKKKGRHQCVKVVGKEIYAGVS